MHSPTAKRSRIAVQVGFLALVTLGIFNFNTLLDQYALMTYQPAGELAAFESRIPLTDKARATLYRANPQYDNKSVFNSDCNTQPHELELGCFYRGRIFILRIENTSLSSEMDVVGAHELMHAVWAQLSASERSKLTTELQRVYAGLQDSELAERMNGYAKSEPGEESNELHSILGTEFANLSPVLEAHYGKYFKDRTKIVAAHNAYETVFDTRRAELEQELARIRTEKGQLATINRQLDAYRSNGQVQAYNALVPKQNRLVDEINERIAAYRKGVDEYNELSKSLDSRQITDTEPAAE
jgi:hypothetical protein